MSLYKTYRVQCEGISLASRLGMTASGPGVLFHHHETYGPGADTAAKARRYAIRGGWGRVAKTLALYSAPNAPTDTLKFDLCPSCLALLKDR